MHVLFAVLIFFLPPQSTSSRTDPPINHEEGKPEKNKTHNQEKQEFPIFVGISAQGTTTKPQPGEQKQETPSKDGVYRVDVVSNPPVDCWVIIYTVATIIGVIGGFAGLAVIWKQTKATKIAANAARDSADIL